MCSKGSCSSVLTEGSLEGADLALHLTVKLLLHEVLQADFSHAVMDVQADSHNARNGRLALPADNSQKSFKLLNANI